MSTWRDRAGTCILIHNLCQQVQVAQQVYDLLETHAITLEKSMEDLENELQRAGDFDAADMFYSPGFTPLETGRDGTPKPPLEAWSEVLAPLPGDSSALHPLGGGSALPSLLFSSSISALNPDQGGRSAFKSMPSLKRPRDDPAGTSAYAEPSAGGAAPHLSSAQKPPASAPSTNGAAETVTGVSVGPCIFAT